MAFLNSRGEKKGETIIWILEKNELEFSEDEFLELVKGITELGLFAYLDKERPAFKNLLMEIYENDLIGRFEPEDLEYVFEQALLDLRGNLRF